jgi:hypothetical protein
LFTYNDDPPRLDIELIDVKMPSNRNHRQTVCTARNNGRKCYENGKENSHQRVNFSTDWKSLMLERKLRLQSRSGLQQDAIMILNITNDGENDLAKVFQLIPKYVFSHSKKIVQPQQNQSKTSNLQD